MNFDSRFDCCKACNSISFQCQSNRSPRQIQGQGDCKCNTEGDRNVWMTLDKGKKPKSKSVRDRNESESTSERQKNFLDGHCYCFGKQDYQPKRELKQEKNDVGNSETCKYFWESSNTTNWLSKSDTFMPEEWKCNDYVNPNKIPENILEFKEKVDFLFRIFKDSGPKFLPECYIEQQTNATEGMLKDVGKLLDFNRRLCAAEEGIENLALILEDLIKDSAKKKTEGNHNPPVDFEDMSVSQRISYLKSKNDLMLSFMKTFFKPGSPEEYYSNVRIICDQLALLPSDSKLNQKLDHGEKSHSKDLDRIMETLQKLRMRMTEVRQKKCELFSEQNIMKNEKKRETTVKHAKNKLEVISEQAELDLSDGSENAADDLERKSTSRILNEKSSEVNEESDESDLSIQDVTFRILAEEAEFLTPSLDKLLFSKLESSDKKSANGSNIQISLKEESQDGGVGSSSELGCYYCDGEKPGKPKERNKITVHTKPKEFKDPIKKEKSVERTSSKQNCGRKVDEYLEGSIQSSRKVMHEAGYSLFTSRGNRTRYSVPELSSPSREEGKREVRRPEQRQRPMTDPSCQRKTLSPTNLKPPLPGKPTTRNSGINNVKSKNKMLLSKRSCVQTS